MLRRLSPKSQQIIDQAQAIARQYEQDYVDGEHVLLAIAEANDSPAGQVLRDSGATPDGIRTTIKQALKQHPAEIFVTGRLPGTMHFKNIIAQAIEIAEGRRSPAVEPEHLLLALSREQGSLALRALESAGLDTRKIEQMLGQGK